MNLSEKDFFFRAPRGRHGPKLKIKKRPKKSSAANFKNPKNYFLYVLKGPFQHIKDLRDHFLISESYSEKGVLTACQKQILGFDLF
jgi:hypothetical protein